LLPQFAALKDWTPPSTWWRKHAPWVVPVVLLIVTVAALGIKWHFDAAEAPAFPELRLPNANSSALPMGPASDDRDAIEPDR
jgi:hypothetical protein